MINASAIAAFTLSSASIPSTLPSWISVPLASQARWSQYLSTSPQHSRVATDCPIAFTASLGFQYQFAFVPCVHEHLPHNSKHCGCINELA